MHHLPCPVETQWPDPGPSSTLALDMRKDISLPDVVCEHKKALGKFSATGVNQGRMYAIAPTKFYAALGICGVPVYVIIAEGPMAVVTVTYGEEWHDHPFNGGGYETTSSADDSTPVPKFMWSSEMRFPTTFPRPWESSVFLRFSLNCALR